MEERRKSKRLELDVTLKLERLDENGVATLKYVHISVQDISKSGIGFRSEQKLEVGSFYNARLQIWTKEVIDTVIKIIRRDEQDNSYRYGGQFVGMADADALKIEIYQMFSDAEN